MGKFEERFGFHPTNKKFGGFLAAVLFVTIIVIPRTIIPFTEEVITGDMINLTVALLALVPLVLSLVSFICKSPIQAANYFLIALMYGIPVLSGSLHVSLIVIGGVWAGILFIYSMTG